MQRLTNGINADNRRSLLAAGGLFVLLYAAWLLWGRESGWERFLIGNLTMVFSSLVTIWLAFIARQRSQTAQQRSAWSWLALGLLVWIVGDLARLLAQLGQDGFKFHQPELNIIYLAGSLLLWIGLGIYPRQPRQQFSRLVILVDMALVTTAALTMVWMMILEPIIDALSSSTLGGLMIVLFPLINLGSLLLLLNLFLVSDTDHLPAPFGWITLGMVSYTVSDLAYTSLMAAGGYQSGVPSDLGWVIGDALLALGALAQIGTQPAGEVAHDPLLLRRLRARLQSLLPLILAMVLGWYTLLLWTWHGQLSLLGLWVTLALGLGLIARQGFLAGEVVMQQYASLVNSVAEPTFLCDRRGRLQLVNPALLQATGYRSWQELMGVPLQQLLHPATETAQMVRQGLSGGWSGELHLRQKDGTLIPISLSLRPLVPAGGDRLALAGTAHDLSVQKRQQAALQAAYEQIAADRSTLERLNAQLEQRVAEQTADLRQALQQLEAQNLALQQLDRLKSEFVSLVSHELRAPLTNISGGIELLLTGSQRSSKAEKLPRRARLNLELVQAEIARLTRFVETILDLSALEAGRMPLYLAPVALQAVAGSLVQQLNRSPAGERVRWQIPSDLPPLLADEQALSSVLFHLLDNAFKYAGQGSVVVEARQVEGRAEVRVLDEGPGIPPESLPLIFDRFYRARASDSQAVYGHGLGLYVIRRLLEAMGGTIEASNRPQGGACFTFWLPLAAVKTEQQSDTSAHSAVSSVYTEDAEDPEVKCP